MMLDHLVLFYKDVSHSFNFFFTLVVLWVVALSSTNKFLLIS